MKRNFIIAAAGMILLAACHGRSESGDSNVYKEQLKTENISLEDAVVGPFVDVLLHELSHAIFDMLKIPLFGKEEDAADQLAAFILLQFGNEVARRTITGAALPHVPSGL